MEPDQPRLGASVMTHIYRRGRNHTSPRNWQPAELIRLLAISPQPKPTHRPKADKVLKFRAPLAPAPFGAKENLPVPTRSPLPSGRPAVKLPHHRACRCVGLSSNPPEKKSIEVPAVYYRLRIFPAKNGLWTSIANGREARMSPVGG